MKNSILFCLLIGLFCFSKTTNAQACFVSDFDFAGTTTQILCSGETPSLPNFTLTGDLSTQVGEVEWHTGDPDIGPVYIPEAVIQTGCEPSTVTTLSAYVACDVDGDNVGDEWIVVASHSFQVYPEAQEPILTGPDINAAGNCSYTLTPACPDDELTVSDFVFDPIIAVISLGVSVSQNDVCNSYNANIPFDACNSEGCGDTIELLYSTDACGDLFSTDILSLFVDLAGLGMGPCELQYIPSYNPVSLPSYAYDTLLSCSLFGTDTIFLGANIDGCDSFLVTTYEPIFDTEQIIITVDVCNLVLPNDTIILAGLEGDCDTLEIVIYNTVLSSLTYQTIPSCEAVGIDTLFLSSSIGCDSLVITEYILQEEPISITNVVDTCGVFFANDTTFLGGQAGTCDTQIVTIYQTQFPTTSFNTIVSCDLAGTSTIDTLTNAAGCDSIAYISYIPGSTTDSISIDTCSTSAFLPIDNMTYTSQAGCDSFVVVQYNLQEPETWYEDFDGDGWGNFFIDTVACEQPEGYVSGANVPTDIQNVVNSASSIECYPNPNNGVFSIQLSNINRESIQLYNQVGKSITFDVITAVNSTQFEILEPNAGLYFVNFSTSNGARYFLKVLVTR